MFFEIDNNTGVRINRALFTKGSNNEKNQHNCAFNNRCHFGQDCKNSVQEKLKDFLEKNHCTYVQEIKDDEKEAEIQYLRSKQLLFMLNRIAAAMKYKD